MRTIRIETPFTKAKVKTLKAGDAVMITGTIYTGRDAAHARMIHALNAGESLPFDIRDAILYYMGPTPTQPGKVIGSAGPTTSYRMDDFTIPLLEKGLTGMIGKGTRSQEVIREMVKNGAVYFAAIGGAGALISGTIKASEIIAYEDLGTEAIRKLTVENFPAMVVIDSRGSNLYDSERSKYERKYPLMK